MLNQLQIFFASLALFGLSGLMPVLAQTEPPAATAPAGSPARHFSEAELDHLLGPIALYPDPLLAQILPAATVPTDIVKAHRYITSKQDPAKIDEQPWEQSVRALAHYPEVIKKMDEKLDWTTEVGTAFVYQPADVFASIQRLREQAASVGNLKDTSQQTIVKEKEKESEKEIIKIVPSDPEVVYVPQYEPSTVYVEQSTDVVTPLVTFGAGLLMGGWLHNELWWDDDCVYHHNEGYHDGSYGNGNNNNINIGNDVGGGGVWKPGGAGGIGGVGGIGGPGGAGGVGGPGGIGGIGGAGGVGRPGGIGGVGGVGRPGGIGGPGGGLGIASKPGGAGGVGKPGGIGKPGNVGNRTRSASSQLPANRSGAKASGKGSVQRSAKSPSTQYSRSNGGKVNPGSSSFREGTKSRAADLGYQRSSQTRSSNVGSRGGGGRGAGGRGGGRGGRGGGGRGGGGGGRGGGRGR